MLTMFRQLMILFVFMFLGWILGKIKKITIDKSRILSVLLISVFLPAKIFLNFSHRITPTYLKNNYATLLIAAAFLLFLAVLAAVLSRLIAKEPYERRVFQYALTTSNYSGVGYILIEAALGGQALTNAVLYCIPVTLFSYTYGYALLADQKGSFKKLLTPLNFAILLGALFGLLHLPLPGAVTTVLENASGCAGPISMLLIGLVISTFSLKELLPDGKTLLVVGLRLFLLPLLVYGLCRALSLWLPLPEAIYPSAVLIAFLPCGMNLVTFPALFGRDCRPGARLVLLSSLGCMATIPLWAWVMNLI